MVEKKLAVEVVCAREGQLIRRTVEMPAGSTVLGAVEASAILELLPAGLFESTQLGIFSRRVRADDLVHDGDRIEIYRPLLIDPMEARRRRAH
ncbi:MAG: RnfH family protein [Rhodanobacter sp.]|jgi:hypothetical protein